MRAVFQATIADFAGNVVNGATLTVRDSVTGNLAPLFEFRETAGGLSNPAPADANGFVRIYVEPGRYDITANFGTGTREWKDEILEADVSSGAGTAAEILEILSTATEEGDFLIDLTGAGLTVENFATLVRAYANVPTVRGASFLGFNQILTIPANDVSVPVVFDATISKVLVLTAGGTGGVVIDVWKKAYGSYPPTSGDSICASAKPTIVAGVKYQDTTLTGWTTAVSAGDVLTFHLESNSVFTAVAIFLVLTPVGAEEPSGYTDERAREIAEDVLSEGGVIINGDNYTVSSAGQSGPINLWALIGRPSGVVTVDYASPSGGIASNTPGVAGLDLRGFASGSELNITLLGAVDGCPGEGGDGCAIGSTFGEDGGSGRRGISGRLADPGRPGGPSIIAPGTGVTFNLSAIGGFARGGGGGGGGGGGTLDFAGDSNAAAGGGGGAGVGGARGGRPGRVAATSTSAPATAVGIAGGDSTGSLLGAPGNGGTGAGNGSGNGGTGGDGGDWGDDGTAGASPSTFDRDYAGGAGGTGGKAIELNGGSVTITDGNDSTHIKGAVS